MQLPFILEEELIKWKQDCGNDRTSKKGTQYRAIDCKKRASLFIILLNNLKELGATKDYFKSKRDQMVKATVPPKGSVPSKTYRSLMRSGYKDLDYAMVAVFGTESDYFRKNGKVRDSFQEIEKTELEEKIESCDEDDSEEIKVSEENIIFSEKPFTKIFDPNKVVDEPEVERITDPEWDKFLGFDK